MRTAGYILVAALVVSIGTSAYGNVIENGDFSQGPDGLLGWTTAGNVTAPAGEAIIGEGAVLFESSLSQPFAIPPWTESLSFTYSVSSVPPAPAPGVPDALFVYLLDPVTLDPILATAPPLFNEYFYHDNGVTGTDYDAAIVDVAADGTVTLDLTSVSAGADLDALLKFSVIGQPNNFDFKAYIDDVFLTGRKGDIPEPVTATALAAAMCGMAGYLRRRRKA